jgi:SAM-dependent methyltransferase
MHQASYELMRAFAAQYVITPARVADVGAYDVNGTFRPLFAHCEYVGIDLAAGPNIDRVVTADNFGEGGFDVVISGSCMEHVFDLHEWANQCVGLAKPGGLLCIVAPHTWHEHRFPVDCWRVFPDGMRWLFRDLEIIECRADVTDTILIARRHPFDRRAVAEIFR